MRRGFMSCLCFPAERSRARRSLGLILSALVDLRHRRFVTQRQAREIIALWQKLSDRDKAAVIFAPRYRLKTSHRPTRIPGVDSVRR